MWQVAPFPEALGCSLAIFPITKSDSSADLLGSLEHEVIWQKFQRIIMESVYQIKLDLEHIVPLMSSLKHAKSNIKWKKFKNRGKYWMYFIHLIKSIIN